MVPIMRKYVEVTKKQICLLIIWGGKSEAEEESIPSIMPKETAMEIRSSIHRALQQS